MDERAQSMQHSTVSIRRRNDTSSSERSRNLSNIFREDANAQRAVLLGAANLILDGNRLPRPFQYYYAVVEALTRSGRRERACLATMICNTVSSHFEDDFVKCLDAHLTSLTASTTQVVEFVELYLKRFSLLSKLFVYLDHAYLISHHWRKPIAQHFYTLVYDRYLKTERCGLRELYWHSIRCRRSSPENSAEAQRFLRLVQQLSSSAPQSNRAEDHAKLLNILTNQYSQEAEEWMLDPKDYIGKVIAFTQTEVEYFKECGYLEKFQLQILDKLRWTLLYSSFSVIMQICIPYLITQENMMELRYIYEGAKEVDSSKALSNVKVLRMHWKQAIAKNFASQFATWTAQGMNIVPMLCDDLHKNLRLAQALFHGGDSVYEEVVDAYRVQLSRLLLNQQALNDLSKYCDQFLKQTRKRSSTLAALWEDFKSNTMLVYRCLMNKSIFLESYRRDLLRRLVLGRNTDLSLEQELVDNFGRAMPETDAEMQHLDVMLKDMAFASKLERKVSEPVAITFAPVVLDLRSWPELPRINTKLSLPPPFLEILADYEDSYKMTGSRNSSKTLDWSNFGLHQVEIEAELKNGPQTLLVNIIQAVVLLAFSDVDEHTVQSIQDTTGLEAPFLQRVLSSFCQQKCMILTNEDGRYIFNETFSSKLSCVKVPFIKEKESEKPRDKAQKGKTQNVSYSRQEELRCQIIKIMKKERTMMFEKLMEKAITACEFRGPITMAQVKRAVDHLVESEFISRGEGPTLEYLP